MYAVVYAKLVIMMIQFKQSQDFNGRLHRFVGTCCQITRCRVQIQSPLYENPLVTQDGRQRCATCRGVKPPKLIRASNSRRCPRPKAVSAESALVLMDQDDGGPSSFSHPTRGCLKQPRSTTYEQLGGLVGAQDICTECNKLGFLARVGLSAAVENHKSLALAGGRNRRCLADTVAR